MRRSGVKNIGVAEGEGVSILLLIALAPVLCSAGILDPWQWARSDRIEVNIPWLPCNYHLRQFTKTRLHLIPFQPKDRISNAIWLPNFLTRKKKNTSNFTESIDTILTCHPKKILFFFLNKFFSTTFDVFRFIYIYIDTFRYDSMYRNIHKNCSHKKDWKSKVSIKLCLRKEIRWNENKKNYNNCLNFEWL